MDLETRAKGDFLYGSDYDRDPLPEGVPMPDYMIAALDLADFPDVQNAATYKETNLSKEWFDVRWEDVGVRFFGGSNRGFWQVLISENKVRPISRDEAIELIRGATK